MGGGAMGTGDHTRIAVLEEIAGHAGVLSRNRRQVCILGREPVTIRTVPFGLRPAAQRYRSIMIVTIDGPAGSGKSTAARGLAVRLGFQFLDTGAMYRVVALRCLELSVPWSNHSAAGDVAAQVDIAFKQCRVLADGVDVTDAIRTSEVTRGASVVAMNPEVRQAMVRVQRRLAEGGSIITEGRDQGTIVFPQAECKFFLTAEPATRALRRQRDLEGQGTYVPVEEMLSQIQERDQRDQTRNVAPLRAADDAVHVDTSGLSEGEVLDLLERLVREKM